MSKETTIRIALAAVIIALLVVIFHLLGNTADVERFGRSSLAWMIGRWRRYGGHFSHGFLVPWVSLWLVWRVRRDLRTSIGAPDYRAMVVVIGALLLQVAASRTRLPRLSILSLIALLWGIPWCLFGARVARLLFFPCVYLLFCIPLTFLNGLTFPLRLVGASASTTILNGLGIGAVQSGTAIHLVDFGNLGLDVADPCSGLKYILAITTLTALYAYITQETLLKKWALFAAAVPIAVAGNVTRIVAIGIAARFFGPDAATGLYHDFSGYIVFVAVLIMMAGTGAVLRSHPGKRFRQWKKAHEQHT